MSAETVLYSTLSGASAVTALVSTRIYPDVVPAEAALPCVAFQRTNTDYVHTIHTAVPVAQNATLEVACMATTRAAADAVVDAIVTAAGGAGFVPTGRSAAFDLENNLWSSVLTVDYLA